MKGYYSLFNKMDKIILLFNKNSLPYSFRLRGWLFTFFFRGTGAACNFHIVGWKTFILTCSFLIIFSYGTIAITETVQFNKLLIRYFYTYRFLPIHTYVFLLMFILQLILTSKGRYFRLITQICMVLCSSNQKHCYFEDVQVS